MAKFTISKAVKEVDDEATGAAMRARREAAGVSLRQLGLWLRRSAAYLSDLERGRRAWTEERARMYVVAIKGYGKGVRK